MGAWGPRLYQDDIAGDVKEYYKDQLHRGKNGEEITRELIEEYDYVLTDFDDAPVFWFALADTQWNLGRLEDYVKDKALYYIKQGDHLAKWQNENPKEAKIRAKVLSDLEQKLSSPQPPKKKISQYKLCQCEWKIGDVYAYMFNSDHAKEIGLYGKYIFFIKIDESTWHPGHIVPLVYVYWTISDELLSLSQLKEIEYIPQFFLPEVYKREPERKIGYTLKLLNTSSRVIPKKQLTFLGNINNVSRIVNEDNDSYSVSWKCFEEYIVKNFENWDGERKNETRQ